MNSSGHGSIFSRPVISSPRGTRQGKFSDPTFERSEIPIKTIRKKSAKICVLDPDPGCLMDVEELLRAMGHQVLCLGQVIGVSNRIRQFSPDLLVVDVMMPTISGAHLIEVLRKNLVRFPPLILHSALDRKRLSEIAGDAAACDYVVKSDNYLELLNRIQYHMSRISGP